MLRSKERGARIDQTAGKRAEHQSELTKKMNQEARVRGRVKRVGWGGGEEEGQGWGVSLVLSSAMDLSSCDVETFVGQ